MSQEEIEALMNGLDIDDGEPEEATEPVKVNTKEIEELLSQTEDLKETIRLLLSIFLLKILEILLKDIHYID